MIQESTDRILEAGLQPISRPNVNFARSEPLPIKGPDFHTHGLCRRDVHIRNLEIEGRQAPPESPLITHSPTPTSPTSINWWPYPPWGQSTISPSPSAMATTAETAAVPSSPAAAAAALPSSNASASITSISAPTMSNTPGATATSIQAVSPLNTPPSNPRVQAASSSHSKYLVPVLVSVGLAIAAILCFLGYRWYSRRLARKAIHRRPSATSFVSGPQYHDLESAPPPPPTTAGSPSKYTRHGAPHAARPLLSVVTRAGSRHSSARSNSVPPPQVSITRAASLSHPHHAESPSRARSPASSIISPVSVSLSDDDNVPYETIRHTSIRRNILERLQRGIELSRGFSRRTVQTYLSAPSIYSGTHTEPSRPPSFAMPPSPPPMPSRRDTDTDWIPGSGFRIVEEAISPPPSVAGLPGQPTSAWDDGVAIRQAVDAHPGERWLAWTRSWTTSPPVSPQDRFTVPTFTRTRSPSPEKRDVVAALPLSPPQLTSGTLHESLAFSPTLAVPRAASTTTFNRRAPRALTRGHARRPLARGDSRASSIALSEGHGSPAMRYAARKTALSRVEDILAHSYSSRYLAASLASSPSSEGPDPFGVLAPSMTLASMVEEEEDGASSLGIVQRLAVAEASTTAAR